MYLLLLQTGFVNTRFHTYHFIKKNTYRFKKNCNCCTRYTRGRQHLELELDELEWAFVLTKAKAVNWQVFLMEIKCFAC